MESKEKTWKNVTITSEGASGLKIRPEPDGVIVEGKLLKAGAFIRLEEYGNGKESKA